MYFLQSQTAKMDHMFYAISYNIKALNSVSTTMVMFHRSLLSHDLATMFTMQYNHYK